MPGTGPAAGGGNPINLIHGNKYQEETDLAPLPGVLGLELKRHYNSASSHPGLVGANWRMSYETVLYDLGSQIQIIQADGTRLSFGRDVGQHAALCTSPRLQDGQVRIEEASGASGQRRYHWRWPDGRTLTFGFGRGGGYPLQAITAPGGEQLTLSYAPTGELTHVRDPQGRQLQFIYASPALHRSRALQAIDTPLGRIRYNQDGLGRLIEVDNGRISKLYHYESRYNGAYPLALTGISLRSVDQATKKATEQRLSTYAYNARGQAILSSKGHPRLAAKAGTAATSSDAGGIEQIDLQFVRAPLPRQAKVQGRPGLNAEVQPLNFGITRLTNSVGQTTEIRSAIIAGEYRLMEMRGPGCATCGPGNMRYGYDAQGQLLRQTPLDDQGRPLHSELTQYDAHGRVIRLGLQDAQASKPRWHTRFEYGDTRYADGSVGLATQPSLMARPSVVPGLEHQIRISTNATGQPTMVTESGFSPLDVSGKFVATAITRSTLYRYQNINGRSLLVELDGPLNNGPKDGPIDSDITRFNYDAQGSQVLAITQPGGFKSGLSYDDAGRIVSVQNAEGFQTTFKLDDAGRLSQVSSHGPGWAKPQTESFSYDLFGNPSEAGTGSPEDNSYKPQTRQFHDALGRLLWRASALGILTQYRYDSESRLIESGRHSNRMSQVHRYAYDPLGRLNAVWNNSGVRYVIPAAAGVKTSTGNPAAPPPEVTVDRQRDFMDDFGRVVLSTSADSGNTYRSFDEADRMVASTDAQGNRARYEYDAAGRIQRQTITDAGTRQDSVTTWTYLGKHLVALDHPTQSERYAYDARGLRTARIVTLKGENGSQHGAITRYEYDEQGALQSTTLPDGSRLEYERNGQGQVVALLRGRLQTPWLQWLLPKQTLVQDLRRDLVGLSSYTTGNGIQALYQRSPQGVLARVVYRQHAALPTTFAATGPILLGRSTQESITLLLGLGTAHAAVPVRGTEASPVASTVSSKSSLPGALGLPQDPQALLDQRYLWDTRGNLLFNQRRSQSAVADPIGYAYDELDRLIAASSSAGTSRYFYQAGRRVLSQDGVADQGDLISNTRKVRFETRTHRWAGDSADSHAGVVAYSADGQPNRIGEREYVWDALGRLIEVRQVTPGQTSKTKLANYRYDHRGLRIGKATPGRNTQYLYDESRQLAAELDAGWLITRQYVYLGEQPIVVLDTPQGTALAPAAFEDDAAVVWHDLVKIASYIWHAVAAGEGEGIVWLHANHLGAPEVATNAQGQAVWQVSYQAFGRASVSVPSPLERGQGEGVFTLNLRLPGQYADTETGLYYNRQRYYGPDRGEYLTPDPLGSADGPNPYAYVRFNPLRFIDPDGLILFAFDGTANSVSPPAGDSISNVYKFRQAYDEAVNGKAYYITGIGTIDENMSYAGSVLSGDGFDERVALGSKFLDDYVNENNKDTSVLKIDTVGFSRGAAEARVWINQVVGKLKAGRNTTKEGKSRCLEFRFEGLWDTVPHRGYLNGQESNYDFGIPSQVKYAVHAVALNEHRGGLANFNGRSILNAPASSSGGSRLEMGFVGSHADIGGGYGTGDLSDAALMWMVEQAKKQGIGFGLKVLSDNGWDSITNPIIHDKSSNLSNPGQAPRYDDRDFVYGNGTSVKQSKAIVGGNDTQWAQGFVSYYAEGCSSTSAAGMVDMKKYSQWLNGQGVNISYVQPPAGKHCQ